MSTTEPKSSSDEFEPKTLEAGGEQSPAMVDDAEVAAPTAAPAPAASQQSQIPNGGLQAGIVNTFGAFQAYYESDLLSHESSSNISWIGTFQGFLLIAIGSVTGPVFDLGYFRSTLSVGAFLIVFGLMMTSLGTEYYQIFLAQGLCVGLGTGCLFLPSVAIVATYFSTKRALAMGITAAGGSIGSVIYPIVFRKLQPQIGFPWATRVLGFIALFTLTISVLLMKPRLPPPSKTHSLFDSAAFKSMPYVIFSIGLFLAFIGLYIPFFYIVLAGERRYDLPEDLSNYMLSVLNAASVFGRIIPGLLADKSGSLEILTYCTISAAIMSFCWAAVHNLGGLVVYCLFYGFLSGAVVSLPTTVVAGLVPELRLMGTWMGMSFSFAGLGLLIGNPIAGTIINVAENKFTGGFFFSASTVIAAGVIFVGVGIYRPASFNWWKKVTGTQREVQQ
ncbi:hypothetical protein EIK77_000897 [Talaromyces pinophilus]|nr:hypothetical protein EIK77_000897 [Talaromyces pinophilus]